MPGHHRLSPPVRAQVEAAIARLPEPHEDEHDRRTLGDRAAALVAWAEREHGALAEEVATGPPPEGTRLSCALSLTVEPDLFDSLALVGRAGWHPLGAVGWSYTRVESKALVWIKRGES